jgi:hypothetical protein
MQHKLKYNSKNGIARNQNQKQTTGPGNNFAKFKEAISKVVIKEYGDLEKLIHQGTYYITPTPDKATYGLLGPASY